MNLSHLWSNVFSHRACFGARMRTGIRKAKSSTTTSSLSIFGLILISIVLVLFLNSASIANPTLPIQSANPKAVPGPTGTLVVQVHTNQNQTDVLSNPTNRLFPLGERAITVTLADNSSSPTLLITDTQGGALQQLAPGRYVVRLPDPTLNIKVPVQIFVGNETKVKLTISGAAYPVVYSEVTGVLPVAGKVQSDMFVEVRSSAPVANVSDQVLLKVRIGALGGTLANATVLAQQPPTSGNEWLELGASTPIDPVSATSIVLTTWTYSSSITVQPIGTYVSADA
jgi:hypothetical protein